jgi:hypothetical protein
LLPVKKTPLAVASTLANKGIMAGANHFYAVRLLEAMNIDPIQGVLLLSFVHYTNQDEIERLVSVLDEVIYANHRPIIPTNNTYTLLKASVIDWLIWFGHYQAIYFTKKTLVIFMLILT